MNYEHTVEVYINNFKTITDTIIINNLFIQTFPIFSE